jgi:hypothetical protein
VKTLSSRAPSLVLFEGQVHTEIQFIRLAFDRERDDMNLAMSLGDE